MNINKIQTQTFKAKLIGIDEVIKHSMKSGLSAKSVNASIKKIQSYFPNNNDAITIVDNNIVGRQEIDVLAIKNKIVRGKSISFNPKGNNHNLLFKVVAAVRDLSKAEFSEAKSFTRI